MIIILIITVSVLRQDFWNIAELIMLALILTSIIMMAYRYHLLFETSRKRREMRKLDYISFHQTAKFEQVPTGHMYYSSIL
mgnify:CR=1 FL=1